MEAHLNPRIRRSYSALSLAAVLAAPAGSLESCLANANANKAHASVDGAPADTSPSANKKLARQMAAERDWKGRQWTCLRKLWQRESEWNERADNPSSDAYGIPQALPGSRMRKAGWDWRTNPRTQIKWGLSYIKGRYNTPCAAWAHSERKGWY